MPDAPAESVAVVGAGIMGHSLAVQFARHDRDVTLVDHRQANLDDARDRIRDAVAFLRDENLTDRSPDEVVDAVAFTLDPAGGVADADIVLETVAEDLDAKRDVLAAAGDAAPDAVLATNTSSIPITDVADGVPAHADRVVGCHWWNPPYLLSPVEIVRGDATSDDTVERVRRFVDAVDRDPILVDADVPGFVWNRVQFAVLRECMHIVESGVASIEDVDRAVRDGYARRTAVVGPFETVDLSGLALFETIADDLYPHLCDDDDPSRLFAEYRDAGRGGVADGAGFYGYDDDPASVTRRRDRGIAALGRALDD